MQIVSARRRRKQRIPKLLYTDHRAIGWHVSYRDAATGLPRKHRFGDVQEDQARILYHQWVAEHLNGKTDAVQKPGSKLQRLEKPSESAAMVADDVVRGSLLHIASDLLRFDEARTRQYGAARTRGTIHPRVRLNRRKMLLDFLEFMKEQNGGDSLKHMKLADLSMGDIESYNQRIALAGYSHSQVAMRLQMIHALIERAGRPEFGHQTLGWNWDSRDVAHGRPADEMHLPNLTQLKRLLTACDLREQAMIWMGIGLGFGPSDLAAVRVNQIDRQNYDLRRGKTGIERFGDTPPLVWNLIRRYVKKYGRKPADPMFITRTGKPLVHGRTNSVQLWWDKLREEIGETKDTLAGFYALRHLGATEYGSRTGISIGQVKRWLGHSASSRVADQYMKPVSPENRPLIEWVRSSLERGRFNLGGRFHLQRKSVELAEI